jgi:hypothetical protein
LTTSYFLPVTQNQFSPHPSNLSDQDSTRPYARRHLSPKAIRTPISIKS